MRKLVYGFGIVVMSVAFLTGCGESTKVLSCTKTEDAEIFEVTSEETYTFKGTEITKVEMKATYHFDETLLSALSDDDLDTQLNDFAENIKEELAGDGITTSTERNGNDVILNLVGDPSKMSEENKKQFVGDSKSYSYDMSKKNLESEGYTCK